MTDKTLTIKNKSKKDNECDRNFFFTFCWLRGLTNLKIHVTLFLKMYFSALSQKMHIHSAGMSQFHPQSAGLVPNKKLGGMYGSMWNFIPSACWTNPIAPCPGSLTMVKKKQTNKKAYQLSLSLSLALSDADATGIGGSPYGSPAMGMGAERASPKYGECLLS